MDGSFRTVVPALARVLHRRACAATLHLRGAGAVRAPWARRLRRRAGRTVGAGAAHQRILRADRAVEPFGTRVRGVEPGDTAQRSGGAANRLRRASGTVVTAWTHGVHRGLGRAVVSVAARLLDAALAEVALQARRLARQILAVEPIRTDQWRRRPRGAVVAERTHNALGAAVQTVRARVTGHLLVRSGALVAGQAPCWGA